MSQVVFWDMSLYLWPQLPPVFILLILLLTMLTWDDSRKAEAQPRQETADKVLSTTTCYFRVVFLLQTLAPWGLKKRSFYTKSTDPYTKRSNCQLLRCSSNSAQKVVLAHSHLSFRLLDISGSINSCKSKKNVTRTNNFVQNFFEMQPTLYN